MLFVYGLFSMDIYRIAVLTYAFMSFFMFYYVIYQGYLQQNHIHNMAIILLIFYIYMTYIGIDNRSQLFADYFMSGDNTGYYALYLLPIFAMNLKNNKNILLIRLPFAHRTIIKRGAMLIEVSVFILLLVQLLNINWKYEGNKNKLILVASAFIAVLIYGAIKYWNILIFRFVNNPSGSGRIYFYDWIYNGWLTGDWINHLFGFGLYSSN